MERLNFNHLFYFYIVAKEGSVKSAAEKLHVSQPTISDQLKLLEQFFGCTLFDRKHKALTLNRNGQTALQTCEHLFETSQRLTTQLRNQKALPKRELDIGVTHFMSQYFIYDRILSVLRSKELAVNVREGERHYLLADLEQEKIDIVFTDSRELVSSDIDAYRVGLNRTFAVAHRKFQKYRQNFPESLNNLPYFGHTNDSFLKYEIKLFFAKTGISPPKVGEADDIGLLQLVTEEGLAFTIVPEVAAMRFKMSGNIIILGELTELQTSVWGLIKRSNVGFGRSMLKEAQLKAKKSRK